MRKGLIVVVVLIAMVWGGWRLFTQDTAPPLLMQAQDCAGQPLLASPAEPWRFQLDPEDIGLSEAWFSADYDTTTWQQAIPGTPWEEQGYDYDGVAWYRTSFEIPSSWPAAYLGTIQPDDVPTVWVNGVEQPFATLIELPVGQSVQIAYRIDDLGGLGGIKQPVRIAAQAWAAAPEGDYVRALASQHPDWPLPPWTTGSYHAWTMSGGLNHSAESLLGSDVSLMLWDDAPVTHFFWRDENGTLHPPAPTSFSLQDDVLPIPTVSGSFPNISFKGTLLTGFDNNGTFWQMELAAQGEAPQRGFEGELIIVTRPFAMDNGLRPIYSLGFNSDSTLYMHNDAYMQSSRSPDAVSVGLLTDLMPQIVAGEMPSSPTIDCEPSGNLMSVQTYDVRLRAEEAWQLTLSFPQDAGDTIPNPDQFAESLSQTTKAWRTQVKTDQIQIPDRFVLNAYEASFANLLLALDPDGPRPGPMEHRAVWVRDAAFIGEALLELDQPNLVRAFLPQLTANQSADGYVPAIIEDGVPRDDIEWDSQGQLIYLIAELYRYTDDATVLTDYYPNVVASAQFIEKTRATTLDQPAPTTGILPPSRSAEDLGPADHHHYWDDFWGIIGLREAAFLAAEMGDDVLVERFSAEADALKIALDQSIIGVMGDPPAYIPNGPEDTTSSAMARGTSNALFPMTIYAPDDPLIQRSFDEYYARFIQPYNGAYKHIFEQYWPYGGMGLARDYVRLGRLDIIHQILGWTLTNQTLPGTFAWAEQVSPATGGFSGGSMPHAWAAATYITLLHDMLLFEDGAALEILAGVPGSWLEAGKTVGVTDMPTTFGRISYQTSSTLTISDSGWQGLLTITLDGDRPAEHIRWRLPQQPTGVTGATVQDGWLIIPPAAPVVSLQFD